MLQIRFSNRYECLLDALLDALATPPESPFQHQEIIVPSAAVRRRVELAAADRFGICSNVRFSFLAQWLWRQIGHVVPVGEASPFTTPVLTWRVFRIFGEPAFVDSHRPLAAYLRHADAVMRYELASRTATLLEQYLTYRPEWLAAWLAGKPANIAELDAAREEDEAWQAALWRRIAQELGTGQRHPSVVFFDAMNALGPGALARAGLPGTAHIFCLPTMPPLYLDILRRLGQWIDLTLYVPNPCREYWFDIVDARRLSYLAATRRAAHHEVGQRLLAAWGKQSQANLELLLEDERGTVVDDNAFVPSAAGTLLAGVQNAILDLADLAPGSLKIAADDRSIEIHVCHSLTRELEVLQDQLLALFAGPDPPLPGDILVVMPDLEEAAPLVDAVFGNVPPARAIPYTITGRPASASNPCATALLAVLAVAASRFQASAVFELLQQPIIARRFGIGGAERDAIHGWMRAAGIRWGIDGAQREELGLPPVRRHSFSDGLDRLFLGYALPAAAAAPLNGRLAAGNPEGSEALALGSFSEFVRRLTHLHDALRQQKTPGEWRQTLQDAIDSFILPLGDEIDDLRETTAGIHEFHDNMAHGGMSGPVSADVVQAALRALLDDPTRGGIPSGAVTFSAMTSLRHLPYRFICVLGLNDGIFPSAMRPNEFDLMALAPRRGDRQRRSDDRNVFLDLLLAARDRLYLSYTGRSVRDNSLLPPSVLVAELLDYLAAASAEAAVSPATLNAARQRLVVEHPLQPFSLAYFEPDADPRRRSFNDEYCAALRQRWAAPSAPLPPGSATAVAEHPADDDDADDDKARDPQDKFFRAPLADAAAEYRDVTLDQLCRFLGNPCRYLLKERLGIALPKGDEELQDDEPFISDWPARDALAQRVLPRLLNGESITAVREFARAGTEYPGGRLGDLELERELQRLGDFARQLARALGEPQRDPWSAALEFTIDGQPWRLGGGFGDLRDSGRIRYRYDDARPRDYLDGWIEHLFLNALPPAGVATQTVWHSRDGWYRLPPVADAQPLLAALLALYREGLRRPLHFFPKSAWSYVVNGESLAKADSTWRSSRFNAFGEDRDAAYRLALRGQDDPLDAEFERCAAAVFAPLLRIIDDDRLRKPQ